MNIFGYIIKNILCKLKKECSIHFVKINNHNNLLIFVTVNKIQLISIYYYIY